MHGSLLARAIWPRKCMRLGAQATSPMRASISTLVPERLRLMDLMDLSGTGQAACRVDGSAEPSATITYMTDYDKHKRKARIPFPPGTRGFLYCHVTDPAHPVANEIRFRVVPENSKAADTQALFARGGDLLVSPGVPWSIRVIKIARSRTLYASLATLLLRDNLVSRESMDHWEQLKGTHLYDHTPVLCHLDQPFAHNLSEGQHIMYVADKLDLHRVRLGPWTNDHRRAGTAYPRASPYNGSVLCCFERGKSVGGNSSVAHVRVLKTLSRLARKDPSYDGHVPKPKVGDLLRSAAGTPVQVQMTGAQSALAILLRKRRKRVSSRST